MLMPRGGDWSRALPPAMAPSPAVSALARALGSLADATDAVALAVRRHDHAALVDANLRADALLAEVDRCTADVGPEDRADMDAVGIGALCARLRASGRRNAYLIERAWAVDAATLRLLAGLGRAGSEGQAPGYGAPAGPTYIDRQA